MKKIVELLVKLDELELEDIGTDAVAFVESPAIELPFMAFAAEEKFVKPESGESEDEFIGRCIPELIGEGYEQDQAAAICYNYYTENLESCEMHHFNDSILSIAEELGESYDPESVHYLDLTKQQFAGVGDFLKGLSALDILSRKDLKQKSRTMYRYAGPIAQRDFCRAMQRLNKLYTFADIQEMQLRGLNSNMGHNGQPYSIWSWKGGPNCTHYWEELTVFEGETGLVFLSHGPAGGNAGTPNSEMPLQGYVSQETKKRSEIAYAISQSRFSFSIADEEQRIVTGPVLIPNKLIRRIDKDTKEEYWVYFSEKTIEDVAELMFKRNMHNATNVEHDSRNIDSMNTLVESWIVADPEFDKSKALGFDVPKGTLMQTRRVNDDATWEAIKDGRLRGFSIEGTFLEKLAARQNPEDQLLESIVNLLNQVK